MALDRDVATARRWPMFAGNPSRGFWLNVEASEVGIRAYEGDPVAVDVIEDAEGGYYGWIDTGSDGPPVMIQPHAGLFLMQFPYGPKAEVERGKGEIVRLRVDPNA